LHYIPPKKKPSFRVARVKNERKKKTFEGGE